ncbi:unnamed protein product [Adineta steineri]|uniref:Uncharacterized protein n=1 Tax=Adineta steineri TaxID=433720 RepID=A0A814SM06_9BILA|nr:unnamed protein product [Adineta steineri]CAF3596286.1 unnamed protein product [Adineta steineri]
MKLWWYSSANILYAFGSLGYLTVNIVNLIDRDTVNSTATYVILILLAILFVIDALLYTADWIEQRATKKRRELIGCILNVVGSLLYLIGATVFKNNTTTTTTTTSTTDFSSVTDIPAFVFNILGMLAFLAESILSFFMPRVSKKPSKCSIEFFAHLLNLIGNLTYLTAHIVQPIISFIASFTTSSLNQLTDFIFIIIRPIQIGGDIIYTIDAILYIIVWIKANEQFRKVGVAWGNAVINKIGIKPPNINIPTVNILPESLLTNTNFDLKSQAIKVISKKIPIPIVADEENSSNMDIKT